jgi:hypothetical protein
MTTTQAANGGPPPAVVQMLEGYGYKGDLVRGWSAARARVVLATTQREERIALARANAEAADDAADAPPLDCLRADAAAFIEECKGVREKAMAVSYAICHMTNDEVVKLAAHMVKRFRGQA